jgi:cysteine desulfurase
VDQDVLLAGLDRMGLAVSSGSACNSGVTRASHVLRALYGDQADERATVRFSLGRDVTAADVDRAVEVTAGMVERIREGERSTAAAAPTPSPRPQ